MNAPEKPTTRSLADDLSGRQLGDFRLLRRLGRGAMAEVYLAEQCSLSRQVAFKVLKGELASDETYVKRFQREAQAAAALVHASIVQIHEVGCIDDVYFIAQEYVPGINLRQWMARHGTFDLRMAVIVLWQVASALAKAADQNIVHRDIKPENIMIARTGEVKVADFGLARVPQAGGAADLTQVGITMGTPLYMSPEQAEGKPLDSRSDVYSLGVTCYHMLSGSPPFEGETALAVAVQHLKKQPEHLENLRPDLPPGLARIIHKMLAKAPESRYQSPRDLLRDLRPLREEHFDGQWPEEFAAADTAAVDTAGSTRIETTRRLRTLMKTATRATSRRPEWVAWTTAAMLAFVIGGAMAYLATRQTPLLADAENHVHGVPVCDTVAEQWIYAMRVGTEEAWQAVIDHPSGSDYFTSRAKQQLVGIYLHRRDYDQAMKIFEEFASLDDTHQELRAYGLAGKVCLLTAQSKYDPAADALDELWPLHTSLRETEMRQMLNHAIDIIRSEKGGLPTEKWDGWLDEQLEEDAADDQPEDEG